MNPHRPCPGCSFDNPPGNQFCGRCGTPLTPKKSSNTLLLVVIGAAVVIAGVMAWGVALMQTPRGFPGPAAAPPAPTAPPAASPTPQPISKSAADKLAEARGKVKEFISSDEIRRGMEFLKEIPKEAPEYREAQKLLKQGEKFYKAAQVSEQKQRSVEQKQQQEAAVLGPKPDAGGWGGKVFCVDRYLRQTLNDYDSSEYLEWSPVIRMDTKEGPYWTVRLKLRATNAFGGKILKEVIFFIRHDQVVKHTDL